MLKFTKERRRKNQTDGCTFSMLLYQPKNSPGDQVVPAHLQDKVRNIPPDLKGYFLQLLQIGSHIFLKEITIFLLIFF